MLRQDQTNVDVAISKYQEIMHKFKLAHEGLTSLARSVLLARAKLETKMQPATFRRGLENISNEILARVFILDFEDDRDAKGRLRSVCKGFASIIDDQPSFRTYLSCRTSPEDLKEQIRRTGSIGLSVYLDDGCDYYDEIQLRVDILVPHCRRWQHVYTKFNHRNHVDLSGVYGKLENLQLPSMQSLTPNCDEDLPPEQEGAVPVKSNPIYTTWNAPQLFRIVCNNVIPDPIPGMQLTYCDISLSTSMFYKWWDFNALLTFFNSTRMLEVLKLNFSCAKAEDGVC